MLYSVHHSRMVLNWYGRGNITTNKVFSGHHFNCSGWSALCQSMGIWFSTLLQVIFRGEVLTLRYAFLLISHRYSTKWAFLTKNAVCSWSWNCYFSIQSPTIFFAAKRAKKEIFKYANRVSPAEWRKLILFFAEISVYYEELCLKFQY